MWDAIVIGSGIGGLAAAALLARRGKHVLVLEQHTVPGGQTQTFRRQSWTFATGVHYVSGAGPDEPFGKLLHWLGDGALRFAPTANPYDFVRLPGFTFGIPHPASAYRAALVERFPSHANEVARWFDACEQARGAAFAAMAAHTLPHWMAWLVRRLRGDQMRSWSDTTLAEAMAGVSDPRLRAVLGARWGNYGAPPAVAPFLEHALVTGAYDDGAWYPVGGPARIAEALLAPFRASGGELRLGADVHRIVVDDGRVAGVDVVQDGVVRFERCAHVISDIGLHNTLACLPDAPPLTGWRQAAAKLSPGPAFVALYIGLEGDVAAAGAGSANHWIYESEDIGRLWQQPADEDSPNLFVSFPSQKDPGWSGPPTAEVLALTDAAAFAPWLSGEQPPGEDYAAFKDWIAARLLAQFRRHFPALAPMVRFHEAATPLTQRRFARTDAGAMYGLEMTAARLASDAPVLHTPLPGLALAGQDVAGPGIFPSFMSGLMAATTVDLGAWRDIGRHAG